jgi:hypothetical protein
MMLRSASHLIGYSIAAEDGHLGKTGDLLFDDRYWVVRYLVAETGSWLQGRRVLLARASLGQPDWQSRAFPVALTKQQVEDSPEIQEDEPVSRQHEARLHAYYGWAPYWHAPSFPTDLPVAAAPVPPPEDKDDEGESGDPHLRSVKEVTGYHCEATDGELGHVEDFVVDDDTWLVRYVVVDTRNWLPGKKVLVAPQWFSGIRWTDRQVSVDLTREQIKNSPTYDPGAPVNREYEERLYDFYGRPGYWRV